MNHRQLTTKERFVLASMAAIVAILSILHVQPVHASRIKDIASIKGVRENQLVGYGIVVGLLGTGDSKKEYTGMSMAQMLRTLGVDVKADQIESKNVAAVVVTATLPPFARVGQKIDVTVSSIGDSKSLAGGTLLMTPLRGGDKAVYAVAQGAMVVGGFAAGGGGSSSSKNHPTVGMIASGASVEKEVNFDFSNKSSLRLALHNPDFTTAARLAKTINIELGGLYARARDSSTIDVIVPFDFEGGVVELVAQIERLDVSPDNKAKVIVNEKTGTVIVGDTVRISTVAIAHGNLTLEVKSKESVKETTDLKPSDNPAAPQQTTKESVNETTVTVNEPGDKLINVQQGTTLGDVIKALNALGVTPRDLIAILQALKAQGALQAELEIL